MNVSIVTPAYNAANTLSQTLDSLLAQTMGGWEVIIVDDGSSDGTAEITANYAARDSRIRPVSQENAGAAAARNKGIELARFDWLLFLDSDDWILPQYLEQITGKLQSDPTLDAVHCGYRRVAANGEPGPELYAPQLTDLFPNLACMCSITTNSVVIRKSLVSAAGGFDVSLENCEDWDLWQRIARAGARFGSIPEALACYRTRPGSLSRKAVSTLVNGLRVIDRGHSRDERVKNPVTEHTEGRPQKGLSSARIYFTIWPAGIMLGSVQDARPLLGEIKEDRDPELDPDRVAAIIYEAALQTEGLSRTDWQVKLPKIRDHLLSFLDKLEAQSMAVGLAHRTMVSLEHLILEQPEDGIPRCVGTIYIVELEVSEPISDIIPPKGIERIYCIIQLEGEKLGHLSLPIIDGVASSYVLVDAIANKFAWSILGRFFMHNVYRNLRTENHSSGLSLYRGEICLASGLTEDNCPLWTKAHENSGWLMFLQEIWGKPDWPKESFYDPLTPDDQRASQLADDGWLTIEVSGELPIVTVVGPELNVLFTVGGVSIGVITMSANNWTIHAQELRAALSSGSGFELCVAAVREGLLGRKLSSSATLRERLSKAAENCREVSSPEITEALNLPPGTSPMLYRSLDPDGSAVLIGRWVSGAMTSTISRRAHLPAGAAEDLINASGTVIRHLSSGRPPKKIFYAPDMIVPASGYTKPSVTSKKRSKEDLAIIRKPKRKTEAFVTKRLPILAFRRISHKCFEEQLQYLNAAGYYSVNLEELRTAMHTKAPLPGRAIILTFDKGYLDFFDHARPLLKRYGFSAVVFLNANEVGGSQSRAHTGGAETAMLDWRQVRQLCDEDVEFGSYFAAEQPLPMLSHTEIVREVIRSRTKIERETGRPVQAIAYPWGPDIDTHVYQSAGGR